MAEVYLPRSLVSLFAALPAHQQIDAAYVRDLIERLDQQWPGLRYRLCDAGPVIREHINIFVDGERASLDTPVRPDAEVRVITAVSGG